jgi:hypothetical protein
LSAFPRCRETDRYWRFTFANLPFPVIWFDGYHPYFTAEGWSRDVTVDIADELRRRYAETDELSESLLVFLETNRR